MATESPAISVENLVKKFGNFTAVDNISFTVPRGKKFVFLGPNGAGKTTTIKILTTLLHPTSGNIKVDLYDPVTEQQLARKSFGIVFQDPSLDDDLTAYENMDFHGAFYDVPKKLRKERIEYLLNLVDLWERKDDFVKTFSGGMKRRLEVARGLIHHPKILFLDEPTLGLDPQTRNHLWDYVRELNQKEGMTVFFTTHYMEEADKNSDIIAIIDHGKIIVEGTSQEIKEKAKAETLEEAFLKLTGHSIRKEAGTAQDQLRAMAKLWGRR